MSGLSLVNPWLALGLLGVAAPIIIHFFFRRRARLVEFPAIRFVLLSYKKVQRKLVLYEYLLLAARCLIAALLALALAGPVYSRVIKGLRRGDRPLAVAFVLDTSLSMTRPHRGQSLLERGRNMIQEWLAGLTGDDRALVLDAVRLAGSDLTSDPEAWRTALDRMVPGYAPSRMNEAIGLAASRLSSLPDRDRVIVVVTDLQRTGWTRSEEPASELPQVLVVDVAEGLQPSNLAVSGLGIKWKTLAREEAVELTAKIANYGAGDAARALCRVEFEGQTFAQGFADVPAGEAVEKSFVLTDVPGGAGAVRLEVQDGLTGDNVVYFHLKGGEEVRALLVDGDPGTGYLESETYFLDQALNPRLYARSRVNPRTVTVAEADSVDLGDYQAVVLANVEKPGPQLAERLKKFVEGGGGLLITLGDRVNEDVYNAVLGGLLPRELRGAKFSYAGAAGSSEVRLMHLEAPGTGSDRHPILTVFQEPAQGDLGLAGFWKYFLLQQELAPRTKVILRLTDGAPMMVEGTYGRGRVIVFASSADRAWNDFCIHPTFLPLFQQVVQYLGNALVGEDPGRLAAGSVIELPAASDVTGARVLGPDGEIVAAELIEEPNARRLRITRTDRPGIYYVKFIRPGVDPGGRFSAKEADRALVINLDPAESDLARTSAEEIQARVGSPGVRVVSPEAPLDPGGGEAREQKHYAGILLLTLVGLAILERALIRKG